MRLFAERGFRATTVTQIARAAGVSRGTVFNHFPYKEAFLLEYCGRELAGLKARAIARRAELTPSDNLYLLFDELAGFVEENRELMLPLGGELLSPEPDRSRRAFVALPLVEILRALISDAQADGSVRTDFSAERLARSAANGFFLTALQWAAYRQDRSLREELRLGLRLALEGMLARVGTGSPMEPAAAGGGVE